MIKVEGYIKPGTTVTISGKDDILISNLYGTAEKRIKVVNKGKMYANNLTIRNCEFVDILFTYGKGYGLTINNSTYRAVVIEGIFSNCTLRGVEINSPVDYGIYARHFRPYDGTLRSVNHSNVFRHIKFTGCKNNPFMVGFDFGYFWQYNRFTDIVADKNDVGSVLILEWNFDVQVDNCQFTNWGLTEKGHTAAIYLHGSGVVEDCDMDNGWGDGARFFGISLNSPGDCKFLRNTFTNSRKYAACEINTQPADLKISGIYPVNYLIDNNTVGEIQASGYTDAAFDIYFGMLKTTISNNVVAGSLWHNGNNGATVEEFNNTIL